jgi:PAS domain S-box-containing protein
METISHDTSPEAQLRAENAELRARLEEAEETLHAIRTGEVDSLVVETADGPRRFSLQAEERIARQDRELDTLYAKTPTGLFQFDAELRFVRVNEWMAAINGRSIAAHLGRTVHDVLNPELAGKIESVLRQILHTGELVLELEVHGTTVAHAEERDWLASYYPVRSAEGAVVGVHGVVLDITARKLAGEANEALLLAGLRQQEISAELEREKNAKLANREAHLRRVIDNQLGLVGLIDRDGILLEVDQRSLAIAKARREQVIGKHFADAPWWNYDPAVAQQMRDAMRRAFAGEVVRYDVSLFAQGDKGVLIDFMIAPVLGDDGEVEYLIPSGVDIRERYAAEQKLRESEERFRVLSDNIPQLAWIADAGTDGNIRWFNKSWLDYTGSTIEQMTGSGWHSVHHPDHAARVIEKFERHVRESRDWEDTFPLRGKDGKFRWFLSRMNCLRDESGKVVRIFGTNTDITAQRESDEKLRAAHDSFRHLVEQSPFGVYAVDADFRLVQVSAGAQKAFENVRPLIGRDFGEAMRIIWPETIASEVIAVFRRVLETGEPHHAPRMVEARADIGAVEAYDWKAERILLPDGRPGVVCHFYDLSERQRYEALLRESEERYRNLFQSLLEGYCLVEMIYDAEGRAVDYRFLEVNRAFEGQSGLAGAKGRTIREFSPGIESSWIATFAKVVETGEPVRFEMAATELNKRFDVQGYRIDEAGSKKVAIVFNDITERAAAERALRENETRTRLATAATAVGIWEWNLLTHTIHWDAQMFRLYGIAPTAEGLVQYSDWTGAVLPEDLPENERVLQDTVRRCGQSRREFRIHRREDGEVRDIEAVETVRTNENGQAEWVVGTNLDTTERKRAQTQLRQLAAELSEADRRKDEFLATLAHELRNPLAPIRNGLELMKRAGGQAAIVERTRSMMERQLTQMVRLVDDLMDVSRIRRGKLELHTERVPLAAVVESALETSRPLIEQMGQELTVTLPEQSIVVDADMTRLAQVFLNLLNNAAKYSDRGGHIELIIERQGSDALVTVKDTGIGIAADQVPRIFEMFTQVDQSLEKSQGGLGIGLTLASRLAEMHGGTIEARSEGPGKGSQFLVRLPIDIKATNSQASGHEAEHPAMSSHRILVVDDNRDSGDSLSEMLNMMGHDTRTAYDGEEGVKLASEFRPDVILLDIGLPKLNGYEACRTIREESWSKGVVLIAVTGWGQLDDRRRSHEAGFDHHMVKPVDFNVLMKLLAELPGAN